MTINEAYLIILILFIAIIVLPTVNLIIGKK